MKKCRATGCDNMFIPSFSTLQKYCSSQCTYNEHRSNQSDKKIEFKPIKKLSDKRKKENAIYLREVTAFLNLPENKICPVTKGRTTEVHHMKGRIGKLLLDKRYWLAVSRKGHQRIELNPEWAKEQGFSLSRLSQ